MNILFSSLPYYLILLVYLFVSMLTGWVIFKSAKIPIIRAFRAITHTLVGLVVIISLYALVITKGVSILSALLLLIGFALWAIRSQQQKEGFYADEDAWQIDWKGLGILASLSLGWFVMYFSVYCTYAESGDIWGSTHPDIHFYIKIATSISANGHENALGWLNYFDANLTGVSPYHYFDLYFNQILCDITGLPAIKLYMLASCPLVMTLGGGLFVSLARKWSSNLPFLLFLSAMLITFTGINLHLPIHESGLYAVPYVINADLKYIPPFILILSSLIMMSFGWGKKGLFPILALPIISFTYVPAILFGVSSYLFFQFWLEPQKRKELPIYIGLLIGTYAYIFLFYKLFSIPQNYSFLEGLPLKDSLIAALSNPFPVIKIVVGSIIKIWIDYIPHLIITFVALYFVPRSIITWKKWLAPAILFASIVIGGFISWALLINYTKEAMQQFWTLQGAILTATTGLVIIYLLPQLEKKLLQKIILATCCLIFVYKISSPFVSVPWLFKTRMDNLMSLNFSNQVFDHINKNNPNEPYTKIVFYCDTTRPFVYYPASTLFSLNNRLIIESVAPNIVKMIHGDLQKNKGDALQESDYVVLPFYRFCQQNKDKYNSTNILEGQRAFIQENNIPYLITGKNNCNDETNLLQDYQLLFEDAISGINFYERKK